jgi:hypothetical protein
LLVLTLVARQNHELTLNQKLDLTTPSPADLAWLVCGTPRWSDMRECVHSQPSAFLENTIVARPDRGDRRSLARPRRG